MGIWDKIKKGYENVDKAVGGLLPGGVKPGLKTPSPSTPSPSPSTPSTSPSSSGNTISKGSGGGNIFNRGSYDATTQTYTDASGNKQSVAIQNIPKDVPITFSKGSGSGTTTQQLKISQPSNPLISTGENRLTSESVGVPIALPSEANKFKNSALPVWTIQSTNPIDAVEEGAFASNVPYSTRAINTRGQYETNKQNILAGQEVYKQYKNISKEFYNNPASFEGQPGVNAYSTEQGINYELTSDYFANKINLNQIYKDSLVGAKESFSLLPSGTKTRLNIAGFGAGVSSSIIGMVEFGGTAILNSGQKTTVDGKFTKNQFTFSEGTILGDIRTYPTTQTTTGFFENPLNYSKQKITSPEFIGQAFTVAPLVTTGLSSFVKTSKRYGVQEATLETASYFSPLRIKSGVYSAPINANTKFNVDVLKFTNEKGVTTRFYSGTNRDGIELGGYEQSGVINGKNFGGGYTFTQAPFYEVRAGGAVLNAGVRNTVNPYTFQGVGAGSAFKAKTNPLFTEVLSAKYQGGTSTITASRGLTIYSSKNGLNINSELTSFYKYTGGSASNKITNGVTEFVSGRANPIYKTTYGEARVDLNTKRFTRDFISEPSGSYKLNPTIRGVEYNLNSLFNPKGESGFNFFNGGRTGTGIVTRTTSTGVNVVLPKLDLPKASNNVKPILPNLLQETRTNNIKTISKNLNSFVEVRSPKLETKNNQVGATVVLPKLDNDLINRSRNSNRLITIPALDITQRQNQRQDSIQILVTKQIQKVRQKNDFGLNFPGRTLGADYNIPQPKPTPITFGLPDGMDIGSGVGLERTIGREKRYVPSFSALFFNIRGRTKGTGNKTGLDFRPITSGFRSRKIKRLKKIRI